ncbi:(2Fe-2S)-binding protein [Pseudoflavonifractor sp. MSJ-37]|nr:(2Fe-2S)-binding protein [Pseudoflavonifractor sp. MSJ-37]
MEGMSEEHDIVCRCEEVTREEIMEAIRLGDDSLDAIKKRTRAGMGFCQGRTCRRLIVQILSAYHHMPPDHFLPGSIRMPIAPIALRLLASTVDGDTDDPSKT